MNRLRLEQYSYRFAEEVLNSKLALKEEVRAILTSEEIKVDSLSRDNFNAILREAFVAKDWQEQVPVFPKELKPATDFRQAAELKPAAKMDFLKSRVGIEVAFTHSSFMGIDLLKFQVSSYSGFDQIDVGIYVTTTRRFQTYMANTHEQKWKGSLTFEKVKGYLPYVKSAIQVPIYVLGLDVYRQ
jgi:hypothetical protein